MKDELQKLISTMEEEQIVYAYTFLSKLFNGEQ